MAAVLTLEQEIIALKKKCGYKYVVSYTKHFTGGLLAGLTANEVRYFLTKEDAEGFKNYEVKTPCCGSSPYRVEVTSQPSKF